MLGDAAQYVGNTVRHTRPLTTPDTKQNHTIIQEVRFLFLLQHGVASEREKVYCLSARDPTIVPNNIEEPKPAMKSCPISPLLNP